MEIVEPKVYLLGETTFNSSGEGTLGDFLADWGSLDFFTKADGTQAERLVELAGRRCYRSLKEGANPNITRITKGSEQYHKNVLSHGHGSVGEFAWIIWAFESISRVTTHELVRHRTGTAFAIEGDDPEANNAIAQESLRYVRLDNLKYWLPPEIKGNAIAEELFECAFQYAEKMQKKLAELYRIDELGFHEKKKLTSAFRRLIPMGVATGLIFGCNFRALRHIITMRTSSAAEHEIRLVFSKVAEMAMEKWPFWFGDFEKVNTEDGLFEYAPKYVKV